MEIQCAKREDLQEILQLQHLAFRTEAARYNDYAIQPLLQTLDELEREFMQGPVLKALKDCRIIGSVRASIRENTLCIGKLMVHPAYRGQGIGRKLLLTMEAFHPHHRYELFTSERSIENLSMYESMGYVRFKQRCMDGINFIFLKKEALA